MTQAEKILEILKKYNHMHINNISEETGIPLPQVRSVLHRLKVKDVVHQNDFQKGYWFIFDIAKFKQKYKPKIIMDNEYVIPLSNGIRILTKLKSISKKHKLKLKELLDSL